MQAEDLTWRDIKRIVEIADSLIFVAVTKNWDEEKCYAKVLKIYNEQKEHP